MMGRLSIRYFLGAALVFAGMIVPPSMLIEFFRSGSGSGADHLHVGAVLFKINLFVLGLYIVLLARTPFWITALPEVKRSSDRRGTSHVVAIAAILAVALALRIYSLETGLWLDEIVTYVQYAGMPFGEIITTYDTQNNHILYSLLAHGSFEIFGEGVWALRLPAVLFGWGSIWALYFFARQVGTTGEALFSAALLTVSYHHVWFSQNARGYTGLLFWTILSSWLLIRGLREGHAKWWLLYGAAVALGFYTHMTMLVVAAGQFIVYGTWLLTEAKDAGPGKWAGFFLGFCLAGLLTLQLYSLILPQIFSGAILEGAKDRTEIWKNPLWTLKVLLEGMRVSFSTGMAAVAALSVFAAGFVSFLRREPIVVQLLVLPAVLGAGMVLIMGHPLFPRFFFFTMGFGVLVTVRGITSLANFTGRKMSLNAAWSSSLGGAMCALMVLFLAVSLPPVYAPKQDYHGALRYVEEMRQPGDSVVTVGVVTTLPYRKFYKVDWEEAETLEELDTIRSQTTRTWLLYTMSEYIRSSYAEIMESVGRDFRVVEKFHGTLNDGAIVVCLAETNPA